jgi:hypothetical protein
MSQQAKTDKKPEAVTVGAKVGSRLRNRTNSLSDVAREAARQRGMQLIYGDAGGNKVHAGSR